MKVLKISQSLQKISEEDITKEELQLFSAKFSSLLQELGLTSDGTLELVDMEKKNVLKEEEIRIKNATEVRKDTFKTGETIMTHNKKYEAFKTRAQVAAMYNANDIEERSKEKILFNIESIYCRNQFKILVIDDDKSVAQFHFDHLKDILGFNKIKVAHSVEEAKELLTKFKFNLILSDYHLDDGTGYHIYKEVIKLPIKPAFVLITGYSDFEEQELKKARILVLPKPFTPEKFNKIVKGVYLKFIDALKNQSELEEW